jgi:hypothetical protein
MFTLEEYQKLQTAASILKNKGLMQISPPSLVCCLILIKSRQTRFKLQHIVEQLHWTAERTRRSLRELASIHWEGLPLIEVVKNKHRPQGRFTPIYYQLVFRPTPDHATLTEKNYPSPSVIPSAPADNRDASSPKKISPPRSERSRLNNCCVTFSPPDS